MRADIQIQVAELTECYGGLRVVTDANDEVVVKGELLFEASADGRDTISEAFDIEIRISNAYPRTLPIARETGGKIDPTYEHRYEDGSLCLAVPVEARRIFLEQPTLLGFVNKLVIPYLYGYCHWSRHHEHPFGEAEHGIKGIVQYYIDVLKLRSDVEVLAMLCSLVEYGYRGHHDCPCGSRRRARACHGPTLLTLARSHTRTTLVADFIILFNVCWEYGKDDPNHIPEPLKQQLYRVISKIQREVKTG